MQEKMFVRSDESEALVISNMGLASKAANRWHVRTGQDFSELEAVAFIGLVKGCRRYRPDLLNPKTGQPFAVSTIVMRFVNGAILHWFRDKGYTIKFPARWREVRAKAVGLIDNGVELDDVCARLRIDRTELDELLFCMVGTVELDQELSAELTTTHVPTIEDHPQAPCLYVGDEGWLLISEPDRKLLLVFFTGKRGVQFPQQSARQHDRAADRLLAGRRPQEIRVPPERAASLSPQAMMSAAAEPAKSTEPKPKRPRRPKPVALTVTDDLDSGKDEGERGKS